MNSPSPFTPLGAKGLAEGNCMSTPVCIANAIADALGVSDVTLAGDARAASMRCWKAVRNDPPSSLRGRRAFTPVFDGLWRRSNPEQLRRIARRPGLLRFARNDEGAPMKPRPFEYARPDTVDAAPELLAEYGDDARILVGGRSLIPMLNLRLIEASVLIDISRLRCARRHRRPRRHDRDRRRSDAEHADELAAAQTKAAAVSRGAAVRRSLPDPQPGYRCGSIAHADPSSELPLSLAVLGGTVVLGFAKGGERVVAAEAFQQDMLSTARGAEELITAVRFPVIEGKGGPSTRSRAGMATLP